MILELNRFQKNEAGVFGTLRVPGLGTILHTCEDDWLNNAKGKSCIPAGRYHIERTVYHKYGYETFVILGVPNRTRILFHPGNTEEDTEGCILVGMRQGQIVVDQDEDTGEPNKRKLGVVESQFAFHHRFMPAMTGHDKAEIWITWSNGLL